MSAFDKLADVIRWAAEECVPHADKAHHVAVEVRERFVVIDRNDLPRIEDYSRTTAGPVPAVRGPFGNFIVWQSIEGAAQPHATDEREKTMLAHVALHEHFKANPPVVVDDKAVDELAVALDGIAPWDTNDVARALIRAGWKREVTS